MYRIVLLSLFLLIARPILPSGSSKPSGASGSTRTLPSEVAVGPPSCTSTQGRFAQKAISGAVKHRDEILAFLKAVPRFSAHDHCFGDEFDVNDMSDDARGGFNVRTVKVTTDGVQWRLAANGQVDRIRLPPDVVELTQ